MSYGSGESLVYQYMLEGAGRDWSAPTDQRTVNYASLQPGTYRFLVRALSADGIASSAPASVAFTIFPPVWQQGWFLTLAAILVGLAVYVVYRYRVARLIEPEALTRSTTKASPEIASRPRIS